MALLFFYKHFNLTWAQTLIWPNLKLTPGINN